MDDSLLVRVMDGIGQYGHQPRGLTGGLGSTAKDVRQTSSRHVFENQVRLRPGPSRGGDLAEFVELNQVLVPEPGDRSGFLDEALAPSGPGAMGVAQELDRNVAAERNLPGLEDNAHPARSQHLEQLQSLDFRPANRQARGGIAPAAMGRSGGARRVLGRRFPFLGAIVLKIKAVAIPTRSVERNQLPGEYRSFGPFKSIEIG